MKVDGLCAQQEEQTVIIHNMLRMLGYICTFKLAQFQGKQPKQGFIVCKMFLKHHKFWFVGKGKTQTTSLKCASSSKPSGNKSEQHVVRQLHYRRIQNTFRQHHGERGPTVSAPHLVTVCYKFSLIKNAKTFSLHPVWTFVVVEEYVELFVQLYMLELNILYTSAHSCKSEVGRCCNCVLPVDSVKFNQIRESQKYFIEKKKVKNVLLSASGRMTVKPVHASVDRTTKLSCLVPLIESRL